MKSNIDERTGKPKIILDLCGARMDGGKSNDKSGIVS